MSIDYDETILRLEEWAVMNKVTQDPLLHRDISDAITLLQHYREGLEAARKEIKQIFDSTAPIPGFKSSKGIEWLYEHFHANIKTIDDIARQTLEDRNE